MNNIDFSGNLTADPKLHTGPNGPFATFCVGNTPRYFNRDRGVWVKRRTVFMQVIVSGKAAQNVVATLRRGDPVMVTGSLQDNSYTDTQGAYHSGVQLKADKVGVDLGFTTAEVTRNPKTEAKPAEPLTEPVEPAAKRAATKRSKPAQASAQQAQPAA